MFHTLPDSFLDIAGIVDKSGEAPEEDDARDALGVGGGEQDAHRAALGESEERRALRTDFVHDRANVVHPLLERGDAGRSIGQSLAPLVERDDAGKRRKTAQEARISNHFMREFDMRNAARDQDDVDGPAPHCLISDVEFIARASKTCATSGSQDPESVLDEMPSFVEPDCARTRSSEADGQPPQSRPCRGNRPSGSTPVIGRRMIGLGRSYRFDACRANGRYLRLPAVSGWTAEQLSNTCAGRCRDHGDRDRGDYGEFAKGPHSDAALSKRDTILCGASAALARGR